ncbi:hypothetical protein Bpfe_028082, partial [Biomphalaria pfeifferi]
MGRAGTNSTREPYMTRTLLGGVLDGMDGGSGGGGQKEDPLVAGSSPSGNQNLSWNLYAPVPTKYLVCGEVAVSM